PHFSTKVHPRHGRHLDLIQSKAHLKCLIGIIDPYESSGVKVSTVNGLAVGRCPDRHRGSRPGSRLLYERFIDLLAKRHHAMVAQERKDGLVEDAQLAVRIL